MKISITIIVFLSLFLIANTQTCLNEFGEPVNWWVVLKVPHKTGKTGYGYLDSNTLTPKFAYVDFKIDEGYTPLTQTLSLINRYRLEHVAWNDEKPSGQTSSSKGHTKGIIAFSLQNNQGFYITHSIPKFPAFFDNFVDVDIQDSENIYGQSIACFSLPLSHLNIIAEKMLITQPFVYQNFVANGGAVTSPIYKLSNSQFPQTKDLFETIDFELPAYKLKAIFKNDKINGSIFEDGLTAFLQQKTLMVESWGRPIEPSWCQSDLQVMNVVTISLQEDVTWFQSQDHSKWVATRGKYACIGDMNHMSSQWKRGGAFFCLENPILAQALLNTVKFAEEC